MFVWKRLPAKTGGLFFSLFFLNDCGLYLRVRVNHVILAKETNKQRDMKNFAQITQDQAESNIEGIQLQINQCYAEIGRQSLMTQRERNRRPSNGFWQDEIKELKKAAYENIKIVEAMDFIIKHSK